MVHRFRARYLLASAGALAIVLALGLPFVAPPASSRISGPNPDIFAERTVVWVGNPQFSPHAVRLNSKSVNAPNPDEFQITYEAGHFSLDYERVAGGPVTSSFNLTIQGLVEWNDTHGDGQIEEGSILEIFPLGSVAFGRIPIEHVAWTGPQGGDVHSFTIVSNDGAQVTLNLTISERFLTLGNGMTLTPMEAKLTIEIHHVFLHAGAKLALQLGLETRGQVRLDNESWDEANNFSPDDRALNVSESENGVPSTAFFAWSNRASVNGEPRDVTVRGPERNDTVPNYYDVYLAYPNSGEPASVVVVHDPAIGVVSAAYASLQSIVPPTVLQPDYSLYLVSVVAIGALVVATVILARRRRKD